MNQSRVVLMIVISASGFCFERSLFYLLVLGSINHKSRQKHEREAKVPKGLLEKGFQRLFCSKKKIVRDSQSNWDTTILQTLLAKVPYTVSIN